jgi:hypothetical protein
MSCVSFFLYQKRLYGARTDGASFGDLLAVMIRNERRYAVIDLVSCRARIEWDRPRLREPW